MSTTGTAKILVIRRDNIGDLICTTPMIHALRAHFPQARIDVLANSYNAPALAGNPDINHVYAYRKAKHRDEHESKLGIWWGTLKLSMRLRKTHYDIVIAASPGALRFAKHLNAKRVIAFGDETTGITDPVCFPTTEEHAVESMFHLLSPLGITCTTPSTLVLNPDANKVTALAHKLNLHKPSDRTVAIHISARKLSQRWPVDHFVELITRLLATDAVDTVLIFWAPGSEHDAKHPGDDAKMAQIIAALPGKSVIPVQTHALHELITGLSLADTVICSDGGAMHIAAALGKPIVCLFGNSGAHVWRPWGVPHTLLQTENKEVKEISATTVFNAWHHLRQTTAKN
jgi:heptosyltransferase III